MGDPATDFTSGDGAGVVRPYRQGRLNRLADFSLVVDCGRLRGYRLRGYRRSGDGFSHNSCRGFDNRRRRHVYRCRGRFRFGRADKAHGRRNDGLHVALRHGLDDRRRFCQ